jgi:hypothetical protein
MSIDGVKKQGAAMPGPCGYTAPATCDQKYDVGAWNAEGLQGQLIEVS